MTIENSNRNKRKIAVKQGSIVINHKHYQDGVLTSDDGKTLQVKFGSSLVTVYAKHMRVEDK